MYYVPTRRMQYIASDMCLTSFYKLFIIYLYLYHCVPILNCYYLVLQPFSNLTATVVCQTIGRVWRKKVQAEVCQTA